jgi:hypothetical protein
MKLIQVNKRIDRWSYFDLILRVLMTHAFIIITIGCSENEHGVSSNSKSVFALKDQSDSAWLFNAKKRWLWRINIVRCEAENLDQESQTCLRGESKVIENVPEQDFKNYILKMLENKTLEENPTSEVGVLVNDFIKHKVYSQKESIFKEFDQLSLRYTKLSANLDKILGANFLTEHPSHPSVLDLIELGKQLRLIETKKNAILASWTAVNDALETFISDIKDPKVSENVYLKGDGSDSYSAVFSSFFCVENQIEIPLTR